MNIFKNLIIGAVILAGGIGITVLLVLLKREVKQQPVVRQPPLVEVAVARRQEIQFWVKSQGSVQAATTISLVAEVDGAVIEVSTNLREGGFFRDDELLITLDPRDFELAVTRSRSQIASAELALAMVSAEAEVATTEWQDLGHGREASSLLMRRPQLAEAHATIARAQADLAQAELNLQRTRITAPFTGRVREKKVDLGQFVRRGEELAQLFAVGEAEVKLPLPLEELAFLVLPAEGTSAPAEEGSPVKLTASYAGRVCHWEGRLTRVVGEVDPASRMVSVIATIQDPYQLEPERENAPLRIGMFVEAEIAGKREPGVIVLDRTALQPGGVVWVVDGENRLRMRSVEVARSERHTIVIREGLAEGDRICLTPLESPVEGQTVRLSQPPKGPEA